MTGSILREDVPENAPEQRAFAFLQGPPGPLFHRLGRSLRACGITVHRINLSGGDRRDWPDGAIAYRGSFADWPDYFDAFVRREGITDLLLFGDCRPYHMSAHQVATPRGVRTHVLEEGYIRPHWMTLERDGVNARSSLRRDAQWLLAEAARLPLEPDLAPITASFRRRAHDSYWHYHRVVTDRWRYPHYRSHRTGSIIAEGLGWLWKFARQRARPRPLDEVLRRLAGEPVFVLPLQLSGDYQIRAHSPFPDMQSAATFVLNSFAANAPAGVHLLVKAHPLDCSFFGWPCFLADLAQQLGLEGRVHFVEAGDLEAIAKAARGMVCINSTSATLALAQGTPVCTLGEAIYDFPGLTHQADLDSFWTDPTPPAPGVYAAFRRVLLDRCLVRGGIASESAATILVDSMLERLGCRAQAYP